MKRNKCLPTTEATQTEETATTEPVVFSQWQDARGLGGLQCTEPVDFSQWQGGRIMRGRGWTEPVDFSQWQDGRSLGRSLSRRA